MKCKGCEGSSFQAAHRNLGERVLYYVSPFHVFECKDCAAHKWGFGFKPEEKWQWVGHIGTPLLLITLIYGGVLLFSSSPEEPIAAPSEVSASEVESTQEETPAPAEKAETTPMNNEPDLSNDQASAASPDDTEASPAPLEQTSFDDPEPDSYRDSSEISDFVRQQAIRNGARLPQPDQPVAQTQTDADNTQALPTASPAIAKQENQPPPKPPPKRKPALQSLPDQTTGVGIVQQVQQRLNDDGTFTLVLTASQAFPQPRAAIELGDHRQYIDVPGSWQAAAGVANRLSVAGFPMEAVRFGFGESRLRIVFDFTQPMAKPQITRQGQELTLILGPAS